MPCTAAVNTSNTISHALYTGESLVVGETLAVGQVGRESVAVLAETVVGQLERPLVVDQTVAALQPTVCPQRTAMQVPHALLAQTISAVCDAQIVCIWSSRCHCQPKTTSSLALFKSTLVLPFRYPGTDLPRLSCKRGRKKGVVVVVKKKN